MAKTKKKKGKTNHALLFIFITVLLDILALGLIIPILPKLILNFMGGDSMRAAKMIGLFGTVWAFMQFFASPIIGSLSDRFGRRPIILLSNLGTGIDYIVMAVAPTIGWLFGGRIVSGVTTSSISTAFAYIADSTTPQKRAAGFGLIGAAFSVGFVLGPTLGGILGAMDPRLPFWIAAGLSIANFFYGLLVLPESLPKARRVNFSWKKANPVGSLTLLKSHKELFGLGGIYFINMLAHVVLSSVFVLYALYRYQWDAKAVGYCLAVVGICTGIVQGGLIRPFVKRYGEHTALLTGIFFGIIGFAGFGLAPSGFLFYFAIPLLSLWGLANAAAQSLMTKHVSHQEQGQLQGANGSLRAIAELIGPGLFTLIYAFSIDPSHSWQLPGAPFFLAAFLMLINGLLALFVLRSERRTR
jgi:DHA1 family tetracycline resistance protein-like MFS transporter